MRVCVGKRPKRMLRWQGRRVLNGSRFIWRSLEFSKRKQVDGLGYNVSSLVARNESTWQVI